MVALTNHFVTFGANGTPAVGNATSPPTEFPAGFIPETTATTSRSSPPACPRARCARRCRTRSASPTSPSSTRWRSPLARTRCNTGIDLDSRPPSPPSSRRRRPCDERRSAWSTCSSVVRERSGWANRASLPKGTGHGRRLLLLAPGLLRPGCEGEGRAERRSGACRRSGSSATSAATVINPINARNQVEGSVVDGVSEMHQKITFDKGRTVQIDFLRHAAAAHQLRAADRRALPHQPKTRPTGLGEPALPPVLPAVANAIFAATGKRMRSLPVVAEGHQLDLIRLIRFSRTRTAARKETSGPSDSGPFSGRIPYGPRDVPLG